MVSAAVNKIPQVSVQGLGCKCQEQTTKNEPVSPLPTCSGNGTSVCVAHLPLVEGLVGEVKLPLPPVRSPNSSPTHILMSNVATKPS